MTKDDLLNKLRSYAETPDDDIIRTKKRIEQKLLKCPELLYALNDNSLLDELFIVTQDDNGDDIIVVNEDGEWDSYFGEKSHIRPFLFIPETQDEVKHYICYQVSVDENMRHNDRMKYLLITFTIFVHGEDSIDVLTGIPRHDLMASIIRENISWSEITTESAVPISNKESTTDNSYIVRTLMFSAAVPNDLVITENGNTRFNYKGKY